MKTNLRVQTVTAFLLMALSQWSSAVTLTSAEEGRRLYLKLNCYGCHGMHGAGGMGPKIVGKASEVADKLREGDDGMPSYAAYVNSTDVTNLRSYIQTMGTPQEPSFVNWWEDVPSQ